MITSAVFPLISFAVDFKPQALVYLDYEVFTPKNFAEALKASLSCGLSNTHQEAMKLCSSIYSDNNDFKYNVANRRERISFMYLVANVNNSLSRADPDTSLSKAASDVIFSNNWFTVTSGEESDIEMLKDAIHIESNRHLLSSIAKTPLLEVFNLMRGFVGKEFLKKFLDQPGIRLKLLEFNTIALKIADGFKTGEHYRPSWRESFFCRVEEKSDCGTSFAFFTPDLRRTPEQWFFGFLYRRLYTDDSNLKDEERRKIAELWAEVLLEAARN